MTKIDTKIKKEVYESKKARDLLDEEFTEFSSIKRNISEFFNIYNVKFYNISSLAHKFFSKQSLKHVVNYINPKQITLDTLRDQLINIQEDIDSIEVFHPIFPNGTVLKLKDSSTKWLIQSGKKRKIANSTLFNKIKSLQKSTKKTNSEFWVEIEDSQYGIPSSKPINSSEDLLDSISTINTYTGPY